MFDTLAVAAFITGSDARHNGRLHVQAFLPQKPIAMCIASNESPQIRWKNVPSEANSLALIVRDKTHFYWVVYNLPVDAKGLPLDANTQINPHNEGFNSWGVKNYHAICNNKNVSVELFALDRRFTAYHEHITGDKLLQKMQGHVLEKAVTSFF